MSSLTLLIVATGILMLTTLVVFLVLSEGTNQQYPHDFRYTINHVEKCDSSHTIQLLIMVHSACNHFDQRLAIRQTWGWAVKRKDVRLLFLLGSSTREELQQGIVEEDSTFGDILQEDFLDTYHNLTLKTIMMVKWVATYCPSANYVLKIDDDCFLNPDSLLAFLDQNLTEVAIYGRIFRYSMPFREKESKWYMPFSMYPYHVYPDFVAGPSYLLTQKAVPLLYATVLTTSQIYLEDVYLNGICAKKAKIPLIHNEGFYVPSTMLDKVLVLRKTVLTSHEFSRNILRLLWWILLDERGVLLDDVLVSGGQNALNAVNSTSDGRAVD